jgi:hypothetical protein
MATAMFVLVTGLMFSCAAFAVEMCRGKRARTELGRQLVPKGSLVNELAIVLFACVFVYSAEKSDNTIKTVVVIAKRAEILQLRRARDDASEAALAREAEQQASALQEQARALEEKQKVLRGRIHVRFRVRIAIRFEVRFLVKGLSRFNF